MTLNSWRNRILLAIGLVIILVLSIYILIQIFLPDVGPLINDNPQTTALMAQRKVEAEDSGKKLRIRQKWVSFSQIPKLLQRTIRISEDANFYFHGGIDLDELEESIIRNWEKGEFARGASTITQQLAKNLYLSTDKSIWRKVKEFFITRELESTLSSRPHVLIWEKQGN